MAGKNTHVIILPPPPRRILQEERILCDTGKLFQTRGPVPYFTRSTTVADRPCMLHVIKYFAKSLKVTHNHSKWDP